MATDYYRTAVALGVLAGVVEPPSDLTTLTRRTTHPTEVVHGPTHVGIRYQRPSVNREAAAPYPFRPHDHTHTTTRSVQCQTLRRFPATVYSLESTARQRAQPCGFSSEDGRRGGWSRPTSPTVGFPALDATSFDLGIYIYTVTLTPQFSTVRTDVRRVRHRDQTRRLSCRDSDLVPGQSAWQLSCICVLDGARARTGR